MSQSNQHLSLTFDDFLDQQHSQLINATFVVVDLETTGGRTADSGITEIGAVKVQGGQIIGEFQTFVNPGMPIPAFISVLTGITDQHVAHAPHVAAAVSSFLEFAAFGTGKDSPILVAHNAPFDVGFLKAACSAHHFSWPAPRVLDTVTLARKVLRNDEVRNRKLGTLAEYFHSEVTPNHRALDDARATVHVLHGLIERLGNLGVDTYEALVQFNGQATEKRRRKRHLVDDVPSGPGVYIFSDLNNRPLYVGKSKDMRKRVMSYFTSAETRGRMNQMVDLAQSVTAIPCSTDLEASIRELRMISELKPRFNVRSRNPERTTFVGLTNERFPRLSIVRNPDLHDDSRSLIGPFRSREFAQIAIDGLHDSIPLRQCTPRITVSARGPACALLEMGKCIGPCLDGSQTDAYDVVINNARTAMRSDPSSVVNSLSQKLAVLVRSERFEEAAVVRDRLESLSSGVHRAALIRALQEIPELVAARPTETGGWDIHVIRHGWLAAAANAQHGKDPREILESCVKSAATYLGNTPLVSESEMLISWLANGNTRLVRISDGHAWSTPISARPYSAEIAKRWLTDISTVSADIAEPVSID
jgi:DNA polymerase-3 subunit epsilon